MKPVDRQHRPTGRRAFWEGPSFPRLSEIGAAVRHFREHQSFAEPGRDPRRR